MKVASDAIRLVSRMNRDWIVQGRRPSGICGACLLLAARMNNYRRSVREVVYVVKVADLTIQKRLEEFKMTKSSSLTVGEFRNLWLEQAHDPPSFGPKKSKKRKRVRDVTDDGEVTGDVDGETTGENDPTTSTTTGAQSKRARGEGLSTPEPSQPPPPRRDADGFVIPEVPIDPALLLDPALFDQTNPSSKTALPTPPPTQQPPTDDEDPTAAHIESIADEAIESEINNIMSSADSVDAATSLEKDIEAAKQAEKEEYRRKHRSTSVSSHKSTSASAAPNQVDGIGEGEGDISAILDDDGNAVYNATSDLDENSDSDSDDLSLYDDWETSSALLTPAETLIKERIWTELNKEYIKEQEAKKLKAERDARNGVGKGSRKRRGGGKGGRGSGMGGGGAGGQGRMMAASPAESAKEMLAKRTYSKKINYAALDHLFQED